MLRIVLAEDHIILREGLKVLLNNEDDITLVGEADDGESALALLKEFKPDLLITDIMMPGMDWLEFIAEIRNQHPDMKVITLTAVTEPEIIRQSLSLGVMGYIVKDSAFSDLLLAIKRVMSGERFMSPAIGEVLGEEYPEREPLTRREREILRLIAGGKTNKMIAEELHISLKTVETHRTNIMQKLDIHSTADLVRFAVNAGMV